MMRIGRDAAHQYFMRCLAECISRGYFEVDDESAVAWAKKTSEQLKGKQHDDFLLSGKLVSEASEEDLRWALALSRRRRDFLNWAMSLMEEGKAPEWKMSVFPEPVNVEVTV